MKKLLLSATVLLLSFLTGIASPAGKFRTDSGLTLSVELCADGIFRIQIQTL